MESIESGAKHLRSSLAALSSAETRARAMASLTRRADLASGDAPPQIAGASAYVATLERALDDFDVNNAHHVARAQRVSDAAQDLSTKLRGHAEAWRETDEALASLPECVARAWALDKDVAETCDLMSRTELLLLEAEIAVEVDELYRRDEETRVVRVERGCLGVGDGLVRGVRVGGSRRATRLRRRASTLRRVIPRATRVVLEICVDAPV